MLGLFSASALPTTSHPYLALSRLHLSLLIASLGSNPENLDEAIRTSARCVGAMMELLVEGHPARGVGLAELGKLLVVDEPATPENKALSDSPSSGKPSGSGQSGDGSAAIFPPKGEARLRLAHETLLRAMKELELGFGAGGGEVGAEVQKVAREVDKEVNIWTRGIRNARAQA